MRSIVLSIELDRIYRNQFTFKIPIWKSVRILAIFFGKERTSVDASDNQRRTIEDLEYLSVGNERSEKMSD